MKVKTLFRYDPQYRSEIAGIVRGAGDARSISDQVREFEQLENQCNALVARQEALSRAIAARNAGAAAAGLRDAGGAPLRLTDRPYDEFRGTLELAQKCIRGALPLATRRFIENLDRAEIPEIERLEGQIRSLQAEMRRLEDQILQSVPTCLEDVSAKLKFVVALMLDGQEIETDYFAWLVEECAQMMDGTIGRLRLAASIPAQRGA